MSEQRDENDTACRSCGLDPSPAWDTAEGRIPMCSACAVMHGIGCP